MNNAAVARLIILTVRIVRSCPLVPGGCELVAVSVKQQLMDVLRDVKPTMRILSCHDGLDLALNT